jgi:hypothetical protein
MVPCTFGKADDINLVDGASLDSEWDESSRCECLICGWNGILSEVQSRQPVAGRRPTPAPAAAPSPPARRSARLGVDLDQLRQRLDTAPCPAAWRPQIEALISEVERLRGAIDVMARVSTASRRTGRAASDDDTVVG